MHQIKLIILLGILSITQLVHAETIRYQPSNLRVTVVSFAQDKGSIQVRFGEDELLTYKILHYTTRGHKPTTFSDSRGLKIDYSTLAAVGYIHEARLSLSGDIVTHLAVVRLQPE